MSALLNVGTSRFSPETHRTVAAELKRWNEERLDVVVPTSSINTDDKGSIWLNVSTKFFKVGNRMFSDFTKAEQYLDDLQSDGDTDASISVISEQELHIPLAQSARTQLLSRLGLPVRYANKQATKGNSDLVWRHINDCLKREESHMLLRILDGQVRAVLSSRYRIIDSYQMFVESLDIIDKVDADIMEAKLFPSGFQLLACHKGMIEDVETHLKELSRTHGHPISRPDHPDGDAHFAMLSISNFENGDGTASVQAGVLRKACMNTMLLRDKVLSLTHSGADISAKLASHLVLSAETRNKIADAELSKIRDAVSAVFDKERFSKIMLALANATMVDIPEGVANKAVKALVIENNLPRKDVDILLENLLTSRDLSRYGLIQAATAMTNKRSGLEAYNYELAGGQVLDLENDKFHSWIEKGAAKFDKEDTTEEELLLV